MLVTLEGVRDASEYGVEGAGTVEDAGECAEEPWKMTLEILL
jgi:hypothetical protein